MRGNGEAYLLVLGHREGLSWVLKTERMAFTSSRAVEGEKLAIGDRLFLYTSRGCFGNPTRDRGRVIGEARVASPVRRRTKPVAIRGRQFTHDCRISLESLAPFRAGLELVKYIDRLELFPDRRSWSARIRRPLVALPPRDAEMLAADLEKLTFPPHEVVGDYLPG